MDGTRSIGVTNQVVAGALAESVSRGIDQADRDVLVHEEQHARHQRRQEGRPARLRKPDVERDGVRGSEKFPC
jgi:hypothetical protein